MAILRMPAIALNARRIVASGAAAVSRSTSAPALTFKASAVNSRPSSRIMTREAIFSISGKMCEAISTVCAPASERTRSRTAMT